MKILVTLLALLATQLAVYSETSKPIQPCSQTQLFALEESMRINAGDFTYKVYMKNSNNQIVGFYSWNGDGVAYAEICDQFKNATNSWLYSSGDPNEWQVGKTYAIAQDGGRVTFEILSISEDKSIIAKTNFFGHQIAGTNGKMPKQKVIKNETLTFTFINL